MALLADPLNNNWRSVHLHGHDREASISFRMEWKRHPVALLGDIAFVQYLPWIYACDFAVALHRRMGCSPSEPSCTKGGIRLMATKLAFTKGQLHNLNAYFRKLAEEAQNDSSSTTAIEAIVERLVQRLMLAAGNLDRRFSSVFLVSLNEPRRMKRFKFEYLLRIDALSTPTASSVPEVSRVSIEENAGLPGFIRLKILDAGAKPWREYADAAGRLRRDLVKAKLANLLATAIKRDNVDPTDAKVCGSPGQVVDAEVLDKILKQPDHCRIFYGPAVSDGPLPEPKDHRVVLIEDSGGILLRIALDGCKSREVEVRLLIGIGLSSWPSSADYPQRLPLYHCDALLHYTVVQSGMYAVAVGPYPGARCEDRATLWGIRVPAAEKIMSQHYAADSVPGLTESALIEILHQLREGRPLNPPMKSKPTRKGDPPPQDRLRVVSRHILRTMHRWSLERAGPDPLTCWAPDTLSRHVLLVLDELVTALKCQNLRCYFLPRCNVMLQCARGGIVYHEDLYASDCRLLESYLESLHHRSLSMAQDVPRPLDVLENELIVRWREIVFSLPRGTADADYGYSHRQLEYLGLILEQVLRAKDSVAQNHSDNSSCLNFPEFSYRITEQTENLVFLLKLTLTQAKEQIRAMTNRRTRAYQYYKDLKKGKHCNTTSQFDRSVALLIDEVRADRETIAMDLESHPIMAKILLQWLYFGMDYDRKYLEPVLRPYLNNLFYSLHENCWYASRWRSRQETYTSEMHSLSAFCKSVISQEISPALGIVDFLSKGWRWAEGVTKMIERSGNSLRLILFAGDKVLRYNLTFTENKGPSAFSTWSKARSVGTIARRKRISSRASEILESLSESSDVPRENKDVAGHVELRDASPLTYVAAMCRQRARHRGPGDLVSAMVSLGKFRVLQEVATFLPREQRVRVLDTVQRLARESSRASRKATGSLDPSGSPREVYRPKPESDLVDSSVRLSPGVRERRIIAEHQKQLEREMQEMHDTLRRNVLTRHRASAWDSNSVSSWSSSIDSFAGTITLRKYRAPIWDAIKGGSPTRAGHAACRDSSVATNKSGEMISREESPTWNTTDARRMLDESKNGDELPSWDALEATLNRRLCNYGNALAESSEMDECTGGSCARPRE
ncbi:uncharacterized protein LOC116432130 isoform X2 [Nomia melanderi]|uniref:uncharacterized protein LOC116432130 isoform X2 n=1 Tax=Nomia melanderi TaxID=2448451 RepID=UPI0013045E5B|nr:uncharacterized protein LOC116432130 isoform X2 [Nomia melanderi]